MSPYGSDRTLIDTAIDWIDAGHKPILVTVVRTWGSSPRPLGAMMLIRRDGEQRGSVSGGCVEADLVARFCRGELSASYPTRVDYGVEREEAVRLGLPCGGRLELLVEQLDTAAPLRQLRSNIGQGRLTARRVCLNTGEVSLHEASGDGGDFVCTDDAVSRVFGPSWQLLIIGAGHLSNDVAQLGLMLGYRVIICDPREQARQCGLIDGVEWLSAMPDDAVKQYGDHPRCAVVALSHDPKLDDMALLDALSSKAFYIGALGSKRNSAARRKRLRSLGLSESELQRLHAPVGLPIGSHTPAEIAIAVMAEITAERNTASAATAAVSAAV